MSTDESSQVYYPNTPVPAYMRKTVSGTEDSLELFFGYRHSLNVQTGHVKVYKNGSPTEHLTVDITEKELLFEVIDQHEEVFELRISRPFNEELHLPIEFSKTSTHPFAKRLRSVFSRFPDLPHLKSFKDTTPSAITIESGNKIVLSLPNGQRAHLDPRELFRVGGAIEEDFIGCLFGPVACGIAVAIAILLYSSDAF
jgi:hypothetical protein